MFSTLISVFFPSSFTSMQLAAIDLVQPSHVAKEKVALQKHFKAKRDHVLKRLHDLGMDVDIPPCSTFYIWLNLAKLPEPLNNGLVLPVENHLLACRIVVDFLSYRRSSRNCSRSRLSSFLVFSSTSIPPIDAICSTLLVTTLCVCLSDLPSKTLIRASTPFCFCT
jgi:hypothetical protein